jgi:hypothetical protein
MKNLKMKNLKINILQIFILLFTVSTLITSCSNEENTELDDNQLNSEFLQKMNNFNSEYQPKIGTHTHDNDGLNRCSDCWGGFLDFLAVAGADIVGAGAGAVAVKEIAAGVGIATGGTGAAVVVVAAAVVAGAGASVAASNALNQRTSSGFNYKNYVKSLNILYPQNYNYLSNVGSLHNEQVFNILNNGMSQSKFNCSFARNSETSDFDLISQTQEWQNVIKEVKSSVDLYSSENDINNLTLSLKGKSLISGNIKTVLDSFFEIYNQSENSHNIQDIVNFYVQAVSNETSLSETEKEALIASFSVATESPYFWANQN